MARDVGSRIATTFWTPSCSGASWLVPSTLDDAVEQMFATPSKDVAWCKTPLGAIVGLRHGGGDSRSCQAKDTPLGCLDTHPGLFAESCYANGEVEQFLRIVDACPCAAQYIASLAQSWQAEERICEAQDCVRTHRVRQAAKSAIIEFEAEALR